jgi:hypothetical protein
MFNEAQLAKLVADTVPADRTNAVVLDADLTGAAITVKMTKDEHWEVDAIFRRDWHGGTNAQARVVYSW